MVDTLPDGFRLAGIHHPVNHVAGMMVEDACLGTEMCRVEFHTALDGMQFLRLQVFVRLVASYAVVQFCKGRHAEG